MLGSLAALGYAVALTGCALVAGPCEVTADRYVCASGGVLILLAPSRTVLRLGDVQVEKVPQVPPP